MTRRVLPEPLLFAVFFGSGFAALLYQMTWQRLLMTIYGSSTECIAVVAAAFLIGLGLGSLAGGWVSSKPGVPLVTAFALCELGVAIYGWASPALFAAAGAATNVGSTLVVVGVMALVLILLPTLFMGATLPLLVEHQTRVTGDVGLAVGRLYGVNTLGGAAGAVAAVMAILGTFGVSGAVRIAAGVNVLVVTLVLMGLTLGRRARSAA
jgi:spermidine synthase